MKYDRDILTIEEVLLVEHKVISAVLDAVEYSTRVGDSFFILSPFKDETYVVEAIEENYDSCTIVYNQGRRIDTKDRSILPLFSVGSLISMLSFNNEFDLRTSGNKWIVIFNDCEVYTSEENELLVTFLWYVLKDLCVRGMIS